MRISLKIQQIGCFLETDVQYPKNLQNLHNDLPFLPERMGTERFKNW